MEDPIPTSKLSDLQSQRRRRILEYQADTLKREDPLAANIGAINAEMMQITAAIGNLIVAELDEKTRTVEHLQVLEKPIEMHQRMARQIERYVRAEQQQGLEAKSVSPHSSISKFREEKFELQ